MREILFRGKSTHNGEWHYGWLTYSKFHNAYEITDGNGVYNFVDPDTVGQYTGLQDKNGTKIFDDDLLYYRNSNHDEEDGTMEVVLEEGAFMIAGDILVPLHETYSWELEVVGNIYDNPELLEG